MNGDGTEGLGSVGVNPVVATEEQKPLERIGPAQQVAECQRSDSSLRVCERRCAEKRNTGCHSLAFPPPSEEVSGTKWTTLPEWMKRASNNTRRSLTSFPAGLVRTQWSVSGMESVPVLPIGSGEPRFSGR